MRISVIVLVCFGGVFAGHVPQDRQRGVLTDLLSGNKPGKPDKPTEPASGHDDDGCKRQYPLSPKNDQQLSYAFNRNGISPLLTAPPAHYLEVSTHDNAYCTPNTVIFKHSIAGRLQRHSQMPATSRQRGERVQNARATKQNPMELQT